MRLRQLLPCIALSVMNNACSPAEPHGACMPIEHIYRRLQPFFMQGQYRAAFDALDDATQGCNDLSEQIRFEINNSLDQGTITFNSTDGHLVFEFPCDLLNLGFIEDMQSANLKVFSTFDRFQIETGDACLE